MTWPNYSPACRKEIDRALRGPLVSAYRSNRQWGVGPKEGSHVYAFERALEKAWRVKHCVAVNSGTMALVAAIKALRLPPGSEILTTPYSFSATPASIILAGHTPRFADVDPFCFTLSAETVKAAITKRTRALLVVDLFGYLPDYKQFYRFGLPVIQDNCQAAGAVRDGKHLHGLIACGSGNGQKNIPGIEAGWSYTDDRQLAERMREYISHEENFGSRHVGVNGRMHELTAILARHGLAQLDERNARRRELARSFFYRLMFELDVDPFDAATAAPALFVPPEVDTHVFYVYPFVLSRKTDRARFIKRCSKRGLTIGGGYVTPPLHHYSAFRRYATKSLPVVDELSFNTLCVIYDFTPDKELSYARWAAKVVSEALR